MKITTIGYGRLHSLGDYQNEKAYLEAELEDWEDVEQSYEFLRQQVHSLLGLDVPETRRKLLLEIAGLNFQIYNLKEELKQLKNGSERILKSVEDIVDKIHGFKPQEYDTFKERLHGLISSINFLFDQLQNGDDDCDDETGKWILDLDEECDESNAIPL
ncbi:MAG: hypothetical protein AAGA60_10765 [Cyanobacteria bacterium P01_E01_bin.42]